MFTNFQRLHPAFQAGYYSIILIGILLVKHPIELFLLWLGACLSLELSRFQLKTQDFQKSILQFTLPFLIGIPVALLNTLFNSQGLYPIVPLSTGLTLTWDAFFDGFQSGFRLGLSILWLSHLQETISTSRLLFLLKPIFPSFSLLLTLTLKFFPRFRSEANELVLVQSTTNSNKKEGKRRTLQRLSLLLSSLSAWALEDSMHTAEILEQRGFGLTRARTSYQLYVWRKKESLLSIVLLVLLLAYSYFYRKQVLYFLYRPFLYGNPWSGIQALALCIVLLISLLPFIVDLRKY